MVAGVEELDVIVSLACLVDPRPFVVRDDLVDAEFDRFLGRRLFDRRLFNRGLIGRGRRDSAAGSNVGDEIERRCAARQRDARPTMGRRAPAQDRVPGLDFNWGGSSSWCRCTSKYAPGERERWRHPTRYRERTRCLAYQRRGETMGQTRFPIGWQDT